MEALANREARRAAQLAECRIERSLKPTRCDIETGKTLWRTESSIEIDTESIFITGVEEPGDDPVWTPGRVRRSY